MAKLLNHSIVLLLASLLVLVNARHHSEEEKLKGVVSSSVNQDEDISKLKLMLKFDRKEESDSGSKGVVAGGEKDKKGCACDDSKFKEFMSTLSAISKVYFSKELIPDLSKSALKTGKFYMDFLAKEKPKEMEKLTKVLERSAKATNDAMIRTSGKI